MMVSEDLLPANFDLATKSVLPQTESLRIRQN